MMPIFLINVKMSGQQEQPDIFPSGLSLQANPVVCKKQDTVVCFQLKI